MHQWRCLVFTRSTNHQICHAPHRISHRRRPIDTLHIVAQVNSGSQNLSIFIKPFYFLSPCIHSNHSYMEGMSIWGAYIRGLTFHKQFVTRICDLMPHIVVQLPQPLKVKVFWNMFKTAGNGQILEEVKFDFLIEKKICRSKSNQNIDIKPKSYEAQIHKFQHTQSCEVKSYI